MVGGATNQARGLADDFTKLIIAGDANSAYEKYLDPALMQQISREEFAAGVQSLELDGTCKPNFSSLNVNSDNGANSAEVAGIDRLRHQARGAGLPLRGPRRTEDGEYPAAAAALT